MIPPPAIAGVAMHRIMLARLASRSVVLFAALALFAAPVDAQSLVERLPREEWLVVAMGGQDAGWTRRMGELVEVDGRKLVRSVETGEVRMMRLGSKIEITSQVTALEEPDGGPVRIETVMNFSARETRTVVEFKDGKVHGSTTSAGRTQETSRDVPSDVLGPFGLERVIVARLAEPGAEIDAKLWMSDVGQVVEVWGKVVGREEIELEGGRRESFVRVDLEIETLGMKSSTWYDAEGREQRTRSTVAGIAIETRRTTKAEADALHDGDTAVSGDVFAPSMVKEPYYLPEARRAERAVVRVRPREAGASIEVLEDGRQRRIRTDADGSMLFELRAVAPPPGGGGVRGEGTASADLTSSLLPNGAIQCDAPQIKAMAAQITGDERDAWLCAQRIEAWVEKNVTDKNFDVGFASALEVSEDRAGDCSEHAVLLAALCRASDIPCRVVMGLLYIGGIWGGHAWNEVWIDGAWYALDGTLGLGRADALHLAFSKMTLADGNAASEFGALLTGLGRLDVEVLELSVARTFAPATATGQVLDGRYVDAAFGIAFRLPEGAKAEARRPDGGIGFDLLRAEIPEDGWTLTLRAYETGADGDWPEYLPLEGGVECDVDGRPALRFEKESGGEAGKATIRWLVRSRGTVFEFKFGDVTDAELESLAVLMESVDFDR